MRIRHFLTYRQTVTSINITTIHNQYLIVLKKTRFHGNLS